jgi:hypothetical protein
MFKRMNCQFLMAFKNDKIMSVSLVITEEEILAMDRIYLLPIFQSKLYCRKRRMGMQFIPQSMLIKMVEHLVYSRDSCHLFRLFA